MKFDVLSASRSDDSFSSPSFPGSPRAKEIPIRTDRIIRVVLLFSTSLSFALPPTRSISVRPFSFYVPRRRLLVCTHTRGGRCTRSKKNMAVAALARERVLKTTDEYGRDEKKKEKREKSRMKERR